jgi:hypothetical protein
MFHDRQHAAVDQAFDQGASEIDHDGAIVRQRAIADHVIGAFDGHVQHRHAVDIDAELEEIVRDEARVQIGRFLRGLRGNVVQCAETGGGGAFFPMRRFQARNAAAFLVDQNGCFGIVHGCAQIIHETLHLFAIADVAAEKDEAPRLRLTEKRALVISERRP